MTSRGLKTLPTAIALAATMMTACGGNDPTGRDIGDSRRYPTMATTDVSTLISDSGYTRYHITAPRWLMFEEADTPYWSFPEGVYMEQFDDTLAICATFQADSATYLSARKIWRFDGRVNMLNSDGDRFATSQLFWDQNKRQVYSDSFMHIDRNSRIIEGYGFESNEQFTEYTILHPQMSLPVERSPRTARTDSTSTPPKDSIAATTVTTERTDTAAPKRIPATLRRDKEISGETPQNVRTLKRERIQDPQ
ncbi:MAG: LPS export ABC transporter periplasmic protein LptC [Muribaculaceae bacterium]|nr:LPS export ABC transporter periplasmic protein LptC [Muribaculaceae bacterium]